LARARKRLANRFTSVMMQLSIKPVLNAVDAQTAA